MKVGAVPIQRSDMPKEGWHGTTCPHSAVGTDSADGCWCFGVSLAMAEIKLQRRHAALAITRRFRRVEATMPRKEESAPSRSLIRSCTSRHAVSIEIPLLGRDE